MSKANSLPFVTLQTVLYVTSTSLIHAQRWRQERLPIGIRVQLLLTQRGQALGLFGFAWWMIPAARSTSKWRDREALEILTARAFDSTFGLRRAIGRANLERLKRPFENTA